LQEEPPQEHDQALVPADADLAAQYRRHQIQLAGDRPFEARALNAQDAVRSNVPTRDAEIALVDGHPPALGSPAVGYVEASTASWPRRPSSAKNSAIGSGVRSPTRATYPRSTKTASSGGGEKDHLESGRVETVRPYEGTTSHEGARALPRR